MKTKNTLIALGLTVVFTVSATLAVQNMLPTKVFILERNLTEIDADIELHQTQLSVLEQRRQQTICDLGAQKLADGHELKNPKVFSQLCAEELGLN